MGKCYSLEPEDKRAQFGLRYGLIQYDVLKENNGECNSSTCRNVTEHWMNHFIENWNGLN